MALLVTSSPKIITPSWYEDSTRLSIAGKQTVLADEVSRSRLILSESGLDAWNESKDFHDIVSQFAITNSLGNPRISDFSRNLPAAVLRSARESINGYEGRLSSIYDPLIEDPDILIKTFDFTPRLALRQFDVMGFLSKRLARTDSGIPLSAPKQHAFLDTKNGRFRAVFMEKLDVDKHQDESYRPINPELPERRKIIKKIYRTTLPIGPLLFNDFYRQNFMQKTHDGTTDYYIIDQPQSRPLLFDPSKISLPLANALVRLRDS